MERYDYYKNVKEDVKNYILENYESEEIKDLTFDDLYDDLFIEDSVTGNASGSYTFNTWEAEENLCHNMELLGEALNEFCCDGSYLEKGSEACDVIIRCYVLGQVLDDVIYELKQELESEEE